jgi:hypothetical protein
LRTPLPSPVYDPGNVSEQPTSQEGGEVCIVHFIAPGFDRELYILPEILSELRCIDKYNFIS